MGSKYSFQSSKTMVRSVGVAVVITLTMGLALAASAETLPPEVLKLIEEQRALIERQNQKIEQLERRVDEIDQAAAVAPPPAPGEASPVIAPPRADTTGAARTTTPPDGGGAQTAEREGVFIEKGEFPGSIKVPGTNISIGVAGFVKADVVQSFDDIGAASEELFVVPAIPTRGNDDASGDRNSIHARETRFALIGQGHSEWVGKVRATVEGDFFGSGVPEGGELLSNSEDFRLRLAKVDVGSFTVGQDWTTYGDTSAYPENLDFNTPGGSPFVRQGLVRYTHDFGDGFSLAVAAENSEASVLETAGGALVDTTTSNSIPEFVVRGRVQRDAGHLQLASVLRQISSDELDDEVFGWGVGLSGRYNIGAELGGVFHPKDNLKFHAQYGDGVGRFVLDNALGSFGAAVNPVTGDFDTVETFGVTLAAQKWWTDTLRSNVHATYTEIDNPFGAGFVTGVGGVVPGELLDNTFAAEGNIIWSPFPKLDVGAELQYGRREDADGESGDVFRTQFSAKYSFP